MSSVALKSRLDQLLDEAEFDGGFTPEDVAAFQEARRNFREAGAELLEQVSDELWSYYRSTGGEYNAEQRSVYGIPVVQLPIAVQGMVAATLQLVRNRSLATAGHAFDQEVPLPHRLNATAARTAGSAHKTGSASSPVPAAASTYRGPGSRALTPRRRSSR